jgi:hypothetical protein
MDRYRKKNDPMGNLYKKSPEIHALLTMSLNNKQYALNKNTCIPCVPFIPTAPIHPISSAPPGRLVSVILRNGLGNRIFQILAALGYAEKYKKVCVISRDLVSNGMKTHEQNLEGIIIKLFSNLPIIDSIEQYTCIREQNEMNYLPLPEYDSNVVLQGYFQDDKYFPSKTYIPEIRNAYYKNTFFIHIRAGDYLDPGSFGLDLVGYHKKCLADISTTIGSDITYLVFSNDNRYANNYMKQFGIQYTISDKVNPLDALIEMANCSGGICANSTFSWLGGFFQGELRGKIYMPSVWLKGRDCRGVYPTWATVIDITNKVKILSMEELQTSPAENQLPLVPAPAPAPAPVPLPLVVESSLHQRPQRQPRPQRPPVPIAPPLPELPLQSLQFLVNNSNTITSTYNLLDLRILSIPTGRRLNYNACIIANRIFFRAVNQIGTDDIVTCILDNFDYRPNSLKTLSLTSMFNNKHVEDPRVILHNGCWFVCYTDGYNVGIAKLDANCNTIYSHYLKKPGFITFEGGDGREKNWLPISMGDKIHFWYGDNPRTFLIYEDTGNSLEYYSFIKTNQRVKSAFGGIRGGCVPIPYDDDTQIWFFHTLFERKYRIGAYLTKGLDVISITPIPILTGDHIVFPCGAIQHDGDFYISMGVHDKEIGILKVSRDIKFVPI